MMQHCRAHDDVVAEIQRWKLKTLQNERDLAKVLAEGRVLAGDMRTIRKTFGDEMTSLQQRLEAILAPLRKHCKRRGR